MRFHLRVHTPVMESEHPEKFATLREATSAARSFLSSADKTTSIFIYDQDRLVAKVRWAVVVETSV